METIELKKEDIDIIFSDKNILAKGTEGKIYPFGNDIIKINKDLVIQLSSTEPLKYNEKYYRLIEELNKRQVYVKNTSLPKGIVMYKEIPIASISKYHKGYSSLYEEMLRLDPSDTLRIIKQALINYKELINAGIYNSDFHSKNVLFKDDTQLIDLDSKATYIDRDEAKNEKDTVDLFRAFINDYLSHVIILDRSARKELRGINNSDDFITFISSLEAKNCIVPCIRK